MGKKSVSIVLASVLIGIIALVANGCMSDPYCDQVGCFADCIVGKHPSYVEGCATQCEGWAAEAGCSEE